jgi:hypothetical protein
LSLSPKIEMQVYSQEDKGYLIDLVMVVYGFHWWKSTNSRIGNSQNQNWEQPEPIRVTVGVDLRIGDNE